MARYTKADKAGALETLHKYLKPSKDAKQTVYMLVRSVARSGLRRTISTYVMDPTGACGPALVCLDWAIAVTCDLSLDKDRGVKINGCGMDMGFHMLDGAVVRAFAGEFRASAKEFRIQYL